MRLEPQYAFSILERIVGVETEVTMSEKLEELEPFSILERIVGVETEIVVAEEPHDRNFQYPRTDRWG